MTDFKIDKLGYYKTRGGKKVRVICIDAPFPQNIKCMDDIGSVVSLYPNGKWAIRDDERDIISEWVEPKPRRKVTLKKYLIQDFPFDGDEFIYETEFRNEPPIGGGNFIEIDSKEVELPEGW